MPEPMTPRGRVPIPMGTAANIYGDRIERPGMDDPRQNPSPRAPMGRTLGESGPMPMMSGFGGTIASEVAARQEVENTARSTMVVAERTQAYYDTIIRSSQEALEMQERVLQRQAAVQRLTAETMDNMVEKMERVKETLSSIGGGTDVLGEQSMTIQQRQAERERRMAEQGVPSAAEMQDRAARGEPIFPGHRAKAQNVLERIEALKQELAAQDEVPAAHETPPGPLTPSPASTGRVRTTGQMAAEAEVPEAPQTATQRFAQGQRLLTNEQGQFDVSNLRQTAANRALRFVQEREDDRPQLRQNKRGAYYMSDAPLKEITGEAPPPELWAEMQTNAEGRWYHPSAPFKTYDVPDEEQQAQVGDALRRAGTVGVLRNALGGVARGETGVIGAAANALPMAARLAGVAGAAYAGGTAVADFAERQRAENLEFQQILGGSNTEGFRERLRRTGFRWSQRGVMGQQDTDALYMGMTELDLQGRDRDRALDMATEQFRATGQSVAQSITAIDLALRSGVENFNLMGDALRGVTETAREVGENAEGMRETFFTNFRQVAQTIQGPAAVALAEGLTRAQAGLGNQFENMTANVAGQDQQLMQAALAGMPFGQYQAASMGYQGPGMANDPMAGAAMTADMQQGLVNQFSGSVFNNEAMTLIEQFRREHQGVEPTEQAMENLALQITAVSPTGNLVAPQLMQQLGYGNMTGQQAIQFMAENMLGTYNPGAEIRRVQGETQRRQVNPEDVSRQRRVAASVGEGLVGMTMGRERPLLRNDFGTDEEFAQAQAARFGDEDARRAVMAANPIADVYDRLGLEVDDNLQTGWMGRLSRTWGWAGGPAGPGGEEHDVRRNYIRQVTESGNVDEGILRLLEEESYDPNRRYAIQVRDGEGNIHERVVGLEEAMRLAPDQLQGGTARVVAGEGEGGTVADVTGVTDSTVSADPASVDNVDDVGVAMDDFQRERRDEETSTTRVVVEATPYLERFFQFNQVPTGSRYTDEARANRVPPAATVPPSQLPGG